MKVKSEKITQGESQKREDAGARKGRKVANNVFPMFFPMFCGCGGSISRLAKAAGAEPAGQRRDAKVHTPSTCGSQNAQPHHVWATLEVAMCHNVGKAHALVARSTFGSQNAQSHHVWTTFGSCDVGNVHELVARSTFGSQNVQYMRCRTSARRCGAKHI